MAISDTVEKDIDVSGDRDISRGVDRTSYTGSDDKSKTFGTTTDMKVDVGEAEAVASNLAEAKVGNSTVLQLAQMQALRQAEEMFDSRRRHQEELSAIRQRSLTQGLDFDQQMREAAVSHVRDRHSQDVRHVDVATDRIWNVDEQNLVFSELMKALSVVADNIKNPSGD